MGSRGLLFSMANKERFSCLNRYHENNDKDDVPREILSK